MKFALILTGYFRNYSTANLEAGRQSFRYLEKYLPLFDRIVVHTWDTHFVGEVLDLYKPQSLIVDVQLDFSTLYPQIEAWQAYYDANFDRQSSHLKGITIPKILSQLYTRSSAVRHARRLYEPDYYLLTRLDIGARGPKSVWEVDRICKVIEQAKNSSSYSMLNNPVCAEFNQYNAGYPDYWFFFPAIEAQLFEKLFELSLEALEPGSLYEKLMLSGWPDSSKFEYSDFMDPRQLTNIRWNKVEEPNGSLMKYPRHYVPNVHSLLKYIFLVSGIDRRFIPINVLTN